MKEGIPTVSIDRPSHANHRLFENPEINTRARKADGFSSVCRPSVFSRLWTKKIQKYKKCIEREYIFTILFFFFLPRKSVSTHPNHMNGGTVSARKALVSRQKLRRQLLRSNILTPLQEATVAHPELPLDKYFPRQADAVTRVSAVNYVMGVHLPKGATSWRDLTSKEARNLKQSKANAHAHLAGYKTKTKGSHVVLPKCNTALFEETLVRRETHNGHRRYRVTGIRVWQMARISRLQLQLYHEERKGNKKRKAPPAAAAAKKTTAAAAAKQKKKPPKKVQKKTDDASPASSSSSSGSASSSSSSSSSDESDDAAAAAGAADGAQPPAAPAVATDETFEPLAASLQAVFEESALLNARIEDARKKHQAKLQAASAAKLRKQHQQLQDDPDSVPLALKNVAVENIMSFSYLCAKSEKEFQFNVVQPYVQPHRYAVASTAELLSLAPQIVDPRPFLKYDLQMCDTIPGYKSYTDSDHPLNPDAIFNKESAMNYFTHDLETGERVISRKQTMLQYYSNGK